MLSKDLENTATQLLAHAVSEIDVPWRQVMRLVTHLNDCARRAAELESMPVPQTARVLPFPRRSNYPAWTDLPMQLLGDPTAPRPTHEVEP